MPSAKRLHDTNSTPSKFNKENENETGGDENSYDFLKKLTAEIKEITDLKITTYSGSVKVTCAKGNITTLAQLSNPTIELKDVTLMLSTTISLTGNECLFISSDPAPDEKMSALHNAAIQSARETRQAIYDLCTSAIKDAIDALK